MLLAVEGGGFFSSSASGYSSGLALLILGRRDEEKPIKVSPWLNYHLVEQELEPDSHRAHSRESRASHICASFACFGCTSKDPNETSTSNVGLVQQSDRSFHSQSSSDGCNVNAIDGTTRSERKACLKSYLKDSTKGHSLEHEIDDARELLEELQDETSCCPVTRKVQWTDKCGKELVQIREFEASDYGPSDDEYDGHSSRRCECVIQ